MEIKIKIPESLNEITLDQYQRFVAFEKTTDDKNQINAKLIEIMSNLSPEIVNKLSFGSLERGVEKISRLFEQESKFIQRFKFKGKEYGMIPAMDEMSFGEYLDLENTITDIDTMHNAMAVLFRPIKQKLGHKYVIEDYKGYSNSNMKQMPVSVVLGAMVFFWSLGKELIQNIQNCLQDQMMEMSIQQRQILAENGVGIQAFMDLQKEMLLPLTKLQEKTFINV